MEKYMDKNIAWLKNSLYETVNEFDLKHIEKQNLHFRYTMLKSIANILNDDHIKDDLFILGEQIKIVYGNNSTNIISKLGNIIYGIEAYKRKISKDELYKIEYDKLVLQLEQVKEIFRKDMITTLKEKDDLDKIYNLESYKTYRRIISKLKYNQIIDHNELELLKEYFNNKNLSDIEQIKLFEKIRLNNSRISKENGAMYSNAFDGKEVFKILEAGFVSYDKPYINSVELSKRIDNEAYGYFNTLINIDNTDEFLNNLDLSSYKYVEKQRLVVGMIEEIQGKLLDLRELISQKDFYLDIETKNEIIKDYHNLQNKYLALSEYYDNLEEDLVITGTRKKERILIFLEPNASRQEKTYFEKDMEELSKTQSKVTKNLLEKFIYDMCASNEIGSFNNSKLEKFKELRDPGTGGGKERGQVRIIFRKLKDNYYLIVGMFLKKDRGDFGYERIASRYYDLELTEELIEKNTLTFDTIMSKLNDTLNNNQDKKL